MNMIGQILRYSSGPTALFRVNYIHDQGGNNFWYYGNHCMGGSHGSAPYNCTLASDEDIIQWDSCAKWRQSEKRIAIEGDI